ncbi:PREDICTED: leucine-rich repeat-containing protein 15-like [Dinoponera quadriceps]|uniref:Leucine-rich repeat-containing protein 15-like n=1 Tax=Dinoponera quadriceps TaxID=609295 RepID=A0A6P3XL79_DINQU|nr:PREDICTED: leucine-rich repeat-containing protein 15-like [Dinoponera quadriceps]XP_014478724.1 PREDICTED: leucine-rich repeat-containing protein 15-like [Dinoponera quadriceps]XP_014478725.1 PREDICTED: leucine-rich repeat-containing protein 15-like [Dinoponera quadriceps]XP_014478726.1 PREDICTED: leucine-rich repeat-containing protein 15-like [Dinoponera quadriceps]XP_014478727.1 PREDICTED: leucine-rich repeat-containing protein 15-like [Dinoponera quadriceps]XP_014478728.1 PREDICTED: leuc
MVKMTALHLFVACLAASTFVLNEELLEQDCPVDCHCHYFRINWVTDCSDSNLTTIPYSELSRNVYILDMNDNNIANVGPFPSSIKLRRLQMAHNRLTELSYESFAGLTYLLDADFSHNAIRRLDPEAFRDSPGLITLELQHNPLDVVDGPFLNCRTLLYLDLNSCGIRRLDTRFFYNTTNLNKLDLSQNPLQRIEPGPFDHLTNLEYLKLNGCNLTYVSSEAFSHLENLRQLEIAANALKTLNWRSVLAPLVRLEHLDIRNTGITNLPADAFAKNLYLRQLVLADNELWHLDVEDTLGHNLHSLQSLDLSNCNLQDRLSEEAFRNASKLRVLNLSGNPMFASDLTAVLRHLPKLHKLSLGNCSLRRLPNAFDILEHLEELDISHNPLSDAFVSLLNPLRSLEYLDMSYCGLGYVGNNTFAQMTSLKQLILSGNGLHTLEGGLFANLTRLESLELNNCDLKVPLDPKVFGDRLSTNIIELKLSGNPLTVPDEGSLLPAQLSNLEILDLSSCGISHLNVNIFAATNNLTQLNLSGNVISGVENLSSLGRLRALEHIDLSNNNLSTINPRVFRSNPRLRSINLMGNPFICNCSITETWDWAVQEKGDLHVLVGSQPANFETGSAKRRKNLACSYDEETYRSMADGNRPAAVRKHYPSQITPSRTWAKYVRESNCSRRS